MIPRVNTLAISHSWSLPNPWVPFERSTYRPRWKPFHDLVKHGCSFNAQTLQRWNGPMWRIYHLLKKMQLSNYWDDVFHSVQYEGSMLQVVCVEKMRLTASVCPALLIANAWQPEEHKMHKSESWNKHETTMIRAKIKINSCILYITNGDHPHFS